jgi:hypothetical protein
MTFFVGAAIYLFLSFLFRVDEVSYFLGAAKKLLTKSMLPPIPPKEEEPITPTTDTQNQ